MCFVVVLQHLNVTYFIENASSFTILRYHVLCNMIYESVELTTLEKIYDRLGC